MLVISNQNKNLIFLIIDMINLNIKYPDDRKILKI